MRLSQLSKLWFICSCSLHTWRHLTVNKCKFKCFVQDSCKCDDVIGVSGVVQAHISMVSKTQKVQMIKHQFQGSLPTLGTATTTLSLSHHDASQLPLNCVTKDQLLSNVGQYEGQAHQATIQATHPLPLSSWSVLTPRLPLCCN